MVTDTVRGNDPRYGPGFRVAGFKDKLYMFRVQSFGLDCLVHNPKARIRTLKHKAQGTLCYSSIVPHIFADWNPYQVNDAGNIDCTVRGL